MADTQWLTISFGGLSAEETGEVLQVSRERHARLEDCEGLAGSRNGEQSRIVHSRHQGIDDRRASARDVRLDKAQVLDYHPSEVDYHLPAPGARQRREIFRLGRPLPSPVVGACPDTVAATGDSACAPPPAWTISAASPRPLAASRAALWSHAPRPSGLAGSTPVEAPETSWVRRKQRGHF